jgi:hypothetical protein
MVASAIAFIRVMTKPGGVSFIGPPARLSSSSSVMPPNASLAVRWLSAVTSPDTSSCASTRRFSG